MPATSFSAVLLPDPLRPMTPKVIPFGTANDTSVKRRKGFARAASREECCAGAARS